MEARHGPGGEVDPNKEGIDPSDAPEELDDLNPDDLPRILNAEQLDDVSLGFGQLLALRFSGGGISRRGVNLRLVADLLQDLYRYFTATQPVAAGFDVALQGAAPKVDGVSPPLLQGAVAGHSITVVLGVAGVEAKKLRDTSPTEARRLMEAVTAFPREEEKPTEQAAEFPTLAAASWLTDLLSAEPEEAARQVKTLGRRTTRDFLHLTERLAGNELGTYLRSHERSIEIPSRQVNATATTLKETEEQDVSRFTVTGALYQADARNDRFRLITEQGQVFRGTYIAGMTSLIRDAWAKLVRAKLVKIEYRWVGAEEPHRTVYELESIDKVLGDADDLLARDPSEA